jgi:hypothetical protein
VKVTNVAIEELKLSYFEVLGPIFFGPGTSYFGLSYLKFPSPNTGQFFVALKHATNASSDALPNYLLKSLPYFILYIGIVQNNQ